MVGGPADVRELAVLTVTKVATNPFNNNCYLLAAGDEVLLVDAAGDAPVLLDLLGGRRLVGVVETHGHWDHWQALAEVVGATGASVLSSAEDAGDLPVPVDRLLDDGDVVRVGDVELSVITLVGHTSGSLSLYHPRDGGHLWSGDSLFPGGPGRTTTPEDFTHLMDDLERKIFGVMPDSTWIYPGHGADSTLGAERPSIPQWRARGW